MSTSAKQADWFRRYSNAGTSARQAAWHRRYSAAKQGNS